jgi:uncharacterized protein involved in exopolysaccharide biosynthesis
VVEAAQRDQRTTLRDYLRVVRRRKWIILQAVVLVPLAAVAFSLQQQKLYRANADVLLVQQNLGTQLNGITDPTLYQQPDRKAQTQADLARSPDVARRALQAAGLGGRSTQDLLSHSSVAAKQNADLLRSLSRIEIRRSPPASQTRTAGPTSATERSSIRPPCSRRNEMSMRGSRPSDAARPPTRHWWRRATRSTR